MAVQYSIQKMVSDGTLSTIALGIQYLQRNDIYIRIAGEETPQSGAPSGYTWSFLDNTTLKILPVVPNGAEVVVYRRTDVDAMYNIYSQNAQFDEATIDENNQQLLYIAQEYLEQGIPGAGVDTIEFLRDDGINTYYRIKRTDGSYSEEFSVPSAGSTTKTLAREALHRSYAEAGYNLVDGSFEAGGTLVNPNDVLLHERTGKAYSGPAGPVAAGTDPASGGFVDRSATAFIQEGAGAVPRTAQDKMREVVSVKDFAAVGDGVANATPAFNNTLAGIVIIPPGTYKLGGFVPKSNTVYIGSNGTVFTLLSGATSIVAFPNGGHDITFRNIKFVGAADSDAPALSVIDNSGVSLRNNYTIDGCVFDTFGGMGIAFGGAKGGLIHNCRFTNTGLLNNPAGKISRPAIWLSDASTPPGSYDQSSNITVSACTIQDTWWSAIYALGADIVITGNRIRNTRESSIFISPAALNVSVTDNTFWRTTKQNISASAVEVGCEFCTVSGNTITYAGMFGVSVQDCTFFSISGNNISFCDIGVAVISTSASKPPRYGSVKANKISNSIKYGLQVARYGAGDVIDDTDLSGNWISTSGINDYNCNHASAITARVSLKDNWASSKQPFVTQINVGTFAVGISTLVSVPFRPRSITAVATQPAGTVRQSIGTGTFEVDGSIKQYNNYAYDGNSGISVSLVRMDAAGPVTTINIALVQPVWNTTTQLWDVKINVLTTNSVAYWVSLTVSP